MTSNASCLAFPSHGDPHLQNATATVVLPLLQYASIVAGTGISDGLIGFGQYLQNILFQFETLRMFTSVIISGIK